MKVRENNIFLKHYLYRHIRLDTGQVFYVGIGTKNSNSKNNKFAYARAHKKCDRSLFWKRITNKTDYEVEIMLESDDYDFIKQKELEFISLYGRMDLNRGSLCNLTDGGDGILGARKPEDSIKLCKKTYQYDLEGNFIREWNSRKEIKNYYNMSSSGLSGNITSNDKGSKTFIYKGYIWKSSYQEKIEIIPLKPKKFSEERKRQQSETLKKFYSNLENRKKLSPEHYNIAIKNLVIGGNVKKVLDTKTGVVYSSVTEAAKAFNMKRTTLVMQLKGKNKSQTSLVYAK